MRKRFSYSGTVAVVLIVALACLVQSARLRAVEEKPSTEPAVISIFPLGSQQGSLVQAEIRGTNLEGAYGLWSNTGGLSGEIKNIELIASENFTSPAVMEEEPTDLPGESSVEYQPPASERGLFSPPHNTPWYFQSRPV